MRNAASALILPVRPGYRRALAALALALASCRSAAREAGSEPEVRRQLEREYSAIVAAFKRNDPEPWIDRLAPEFRLTLFNGAVQSRAWAVDYVRSNAHTFQVDSLSMRITSLRPEQQAWVATVEQLSSRRFTDSTGAHRLEVGAVQLETWSRRSEGWRLVAVREKDVLYLRRDGKPPT